MKGQGHDYYRNLYLEAQSKLEARDEIISMYRKQCAKLERELQECKKSLHYAQGALLQQAIKDLPMARVHITHR